MTTASNSRPFAASGTDSEDKIFRHARLRLAGILVAILALIILGFSYALYRGFAVNLQDNAEGDFADTAAQQRVISATLAAEWNDILISDAVVLIVAAGVAYALAGRTLRPVRRAVEAQKAFAAHASHELRTPIAVVKNELEVLARNPRKTEADVDRSIADALEEITRMSDMAENLLALARSEQQPNESFERVELKALLADVKKSVDKLAQAKGIQLTLKDGGACVVTANRSDIERSLLNIVRNAIAYTPSEGSVTLSLESNAEQAFLRVADTGSGIAPGDLPHIFERFYKSASSTGSGLGLSIVKEAVERHGGDVRVESELGKGTTVTFVLPVA